MAQNQQNEAEEFAEEYRLIKKDLVKVVLTNLLIIALLVALFFANKKLDFLDELAAYFQ